MTDWPILAPTSGLAWLAAAALAAGLARGFSGFGSALIFIPVAAMILGPRQAAPLFVVVDAIAVALLTPAAWRIADRREVSLLVLGVVIGTPVGTVILISLDALTLRWLICLLILGLLVLIMSGWRFEGRPTSAVTVAVGMLSGVMNGVAAVGGPPVMAYLLGRGVDPVRIRAVFAVFIAAATTMTGVSLAVAGLFGAWLIEPAVVTGPSYLLGVWGGARMFGMASVLTFRRITYGMVMFAVLLGLPLLDPILR